MKPASRVAVAVMLLVVATISVRAGEEDGDTEDSHPEARLLSNKLNIAVGGFTADFDTVVAAGVGVLGTIIRLEDDLDYAEDQSSLFVSGFWRFKPKHAFEFGYVAFKRNSSVNIDKRIEWEDIVYEVGADVDSKFNSRFLRLGYRYSFWRNNKVDTGVSFGLSTYAYDVAIEGEATVDDGMGGQMIIINGDQENVAVPIPTFGLFTSFAISPKWIFRGEASFLDIEVGDWDVKVLDTRLTVDWYFSKWVGIGGGMAASDVNVANKSPNDRFFATYQYSGGIIYFSFLAW